MSAKWRDKACYARAEHIGFVFLGIFKYSKAKITKKNLEKD